MYDKCYFCLDQLPKLKKESTASFFVNFGRSRGTKEPTYITVLVSFSGDFYVELELCTYTIMYFALVWCPYFQMYFQMYFRS